MACDADPVDKPCVTISSLRCVNADSGPSFRAGACPCAVTQYCGRSCPHHEKPHSCNPTMANSRSANRSCNRSISPCESNSAGIVKVGVIYANAQVQPSDCDTSRLQHWLVVRCSYARDAAGLVVAQLWALAVRCVPIAANEPPAVESHKPTGPQGNDKVALLRPTSSCSGATRGGRR